MNLLTLLFSLLLLQADPVPLLLIDMNGKKPLRPTSEFSVDEYLLRCFPIYASDLGAVIEATEKTAKRIDHKKFQNRVDTIRAAHTLVILYAGQIRHSVTVRYVTRIVEQNFTCDFELLKNAQDLREAQVKLLDFAAYLSK